MTPITSVLAPPPPDEIMVAVWWTNQTDGRYDPVSRQYERWDNPQNEWRTRSEIWQDAGALKRSMAARSNYRTNFDTATFYIMLGTRWYRVSHEELKHYKGKSLANAIRRREGLDERQEA